MSKIEVENCLKFTIWELTKNLKGKLFREVEVEWEDTLFTLNYQISLEEETPYVMPFVGLKYFSDGYDFDYKVDLEKTPCNLGGFRWWFKCPLPRFGRPCGRRVGVLYLNDGVFGCRKCHELVYVSQKLNFMDRFDPGYQVYLDNLASKISENIHRYRYNGALTRKALRVGKLRRTVSNN